MSLEERFRDNIESQQRERITRDHNEKIARLERELKELELEVRAISGLTGTPIQTIENHAPRHESGGTDEINGRISPSELDMPDDDTTSVIGRTAIGGFVFYSDYAYFSHRDLVSDGNYALIQFSDGGTFLNASTGKAIAFRINNVNIMDMNVGGLTFEADKTLGFNLGTTINEISIDGTLAGNSDDAVPTEKAVKSYVTLDNAFNGGKIINGADSYTNRVQIGDAGASDKIGFWYDDTGTGLEGNIFGRAQSIYLICNAYYDGSWHVINGSFGAAYMSAQGVGTDYGHTVNFFGRTPGNVATKYLRIYLNQNDITMKCDGDILIGPNNDVVDAIRMWIDTNVPHIGTIGSSDLHIEPDGALVITANSSITGTFDVVGKSTLTGDVDITGDLLYTASGGGIVFGELWVFENASETVISVINTYVQFVFFDNNGLSNNTTPDHTNDHITINKAGIYRISVSSHIESVAAGTADVIALEIRINNGATRFTNIHAQRKLSGGGGDLGSISMSGYADLAVNDTVELWVANETTTKNVIIADSNLSLEQIGGT